jgi:Metallo-beta-lactamase superfamily
VAGSRGDELEASNRVDEAPRGGRQLGKRSVTHQPDPADPDRARYRGGMSNLGTDATPGGVDGLLASPPAALSFTRALKIHAFRLSRPSGDLLVYAAGGWPGAGDLAVRRYLGHWHEAAEGGEPDSIPVWIHAADAAEARKHRVVEQAFAAPIADGDDFQAIPMPGHTPGSTAFLWDTGAHRVLFTADTIYPRDDGVWRAAVLDTSDRDGVAASLDRLAELEFDVLAPWVSPVGAQPTVAVAPGEGRTRLLEAAERVRAGAA